MDENKFTFPILVLDLEATCWEISDPDRKEGEIIEIGAVLVNRAGQIGKKFSRFVRPVKNVNLSSFCTQLTSITQADVDAGVSLQQALIELIEFTHDNLGVGLEQVTFVSWGNYDRNQLVRECSELGILYPFGEHVNFKAAFLKHFKLKRSSMASALKHQGLTFEGQPHRGVDDAFNLARLILKFLEL